MKTERTLLASLGLDTGLHIGTGKGSLPTDGPLRRANDGRLFLPGRALGGSLRTLTTRLAPRLGFEACKALKKPEHGKSKPCLCIVCQLFGDLYPDEKDGKTGGTASRLWISDAFPVEDQLQTHVRDGVGINRSSRTAAKNVKFDYEIIPRNTTFDLRLKLVDDESDEAAKRAQLLVAALAEWEAGRGQLGGNVARGLGRFHLENLRCVKTSLNSADELIAYLKADKPWQKGVTDDVWFNTALKNAQAAVQQPKKSAQTLPIARGFVRVDFTLDFKGPFLINDPLAATLAGFDHAPLLEVALTSKEGERLPVLPGSSLRGVLRTRAEKIARTLATLHWQTREEFLLFCPACDPLVSEYNLPLASCDRRLEIPDKEEVPEEALCLGCQLFGSTRRGSRLLIQDASWGKTSPSADSWKAQDFLAIDRFTGGGQDGAKFDAAPLIGATFKGSLTLQNPQGWELGWLLLVLRDLTEGELAIGFGAAKGYGQAQATDFIWTIGYLSDDDFPGKNELLTPSQRCGIYWLKETECEKDNWLPETWSNQAQEWVDDFNKKVTDFAPATDWQPFENDTFFDAHGQMMELYGLPFVIGGTDG